MGPLHPAITLPQQLPPRCSIYKGFKGRPFPGEVVQMPDAVCEPPQSARHHRHHVCPQGGGGRYRVPGQPLLNWHQVGGVSRSPDGLFAQQEREPIWGRPAVRGKRTYGGRPGQRVEEQGTWASRTQKYSEAGYGRPVDRGVWTAKTVK